MDLDQILQGDCLELLSSLLGDSVDAIVTDPPYELAFMGRKWDASGIAYNIDVWFGCIRVLKPGGHLLAFGGTRTYHRMACAIEDAGFEIRDSIHWCYGSGFPKSLDVSKALDKMAGAEREITGTKTTAYDNSIRNAALKDNHNGLKIGNAGCKFNGFGAPITAPATPAAKQWAGWGSALKPAHEIIVLARKPLEEKTIAANVLRWGTGGLNIDGCRIATSESWQRLRGVNAGLNGEFLKGKKEIPRFGNNAGRFPANLIWSHSPNCKWIGTKKVKGNAHYSYKPTNDGVYKLGLGQLDDLGNPLAGADGLEEVESWDCDPSCPSWQFAKAGERKTGICPRDAASIYQDPKIRRDESKASNGGDTGSAARFFQSCPFTEEDIPAFLYYAKASRAERERGLDGLADKRGGLLGNEALAAIRRGESSAVGIEGDAIGVGKMMKNHHPTVKPLSLMRYLCRLITPPGGLILDPFAGSGTTCMAAKAEGFHYMGIEREAEYCDIARKRISAIPEPLTTFQ